jgi:hypothetical protein
MLHLRTGVLVEFSFLGRYLPLLERIRGRSFCDPACVKTHTSAKCRKYNSLTRHRSICAQHNLTLPIRNRFEIFLRTRRVLEFSHSLGHEQTKSDRRIDPLHLDKQTSVAAAGSSAVCHDRKSREGNEAAALRCRATTSREAAWACLLRARWL